MANKWTSKESIAGDLKSSVANASKVEVNHSGAMSLHSFQKPEADVTIGGFEAEHLENNPAPVMTLDLDVTIGDFKTLKTNSNPSSGNIEPRSLSLQPTLYIEDSQKKIKTPDGGNLDGFINHLFCKRYKIIRRLGRGGMGEVYQCSDLLNNGLMVALKILPSNLASDSRENAKLVSNYTLIHSLTHENIAAVKDLVYDESTGFRLLVMEYIKGCDLREICQKRQNSQSVLKLQEILPWLKEIAAALDYAHGHGVIHRDVKPSNIRIDGNGKAQLLDFGLASQSGGCKSSSNSVCGTPPYMPPEQWDGVATSASDQYSLAVTAYELLKGRCPFEARDIDVLQRSIRELPPPVLDELPRYVNKALSKALSKNPSERYGSCQEFVAALEGVGRGTRWIVMTVFAIFILGIIGGFYFFSYSQTEHRAIVKKIKDYQELYSRKPEGWNSSLLNGLQEQLKISLVRASTAVKQRNYDAAKFLITGEDTKHLVEKITEMLTAGNEVMSLFRVMADKEYANQRSQNDEFLPDQWSAAKDQHKKTEELWKDTCNKDWTKLEETKKAIQLTTQQLELLFTTAAKKRLDLYKTIESNLQELQNWLANWIANHDNEKDFSVEEWNRAYALYSEGRNLYQEAHGKKSEDVKSALDDITDVQEKWKKAKNIFEELHGKCNSNLSEILALADGNRKEALSLYQDAEALAKVNPRRWQNLQNRRNEAEKQWEDALKAAPNVVKFKELARIWDELRDAMKKYKEEAPRIVNIQKECLDAKKKAEDLFETIKKTDFPLMQKDDRENILSVKEAAEKAQKRATDSVSLDAYQEAVKKWKELWNKLDQLLKVQREKKKASEQEAVKKDIKQKIGQEKEKMAEERKKCVRAGYDKFCPEEWRRADQMESQARKKEEQISGNEIVPLKKLLATYEEVTAEYRKVRQLASEKIKENEKGWSSKTENIRTFSLTPELAVTLRRIVLAGGNDYWIAETEITRAQFAEVASGTVLNAWPAGNSEGEYDYPVVNVSWDECMQWCELLENRLRSTGVLKPEESLRLPTEAEWENAFDVNANVLKQYAWFKNNSPTFWFSRFLPQPVKQKLVGSNGLYDMAGNVAEWCLNVYRKNSNIEEFAPSRRFKSSELEHLRLQRVVKGGSAGESEEDCQKTSRKGKNADYYAKTPCNPENPTGGGYRLVPGTRDRLIGFRIVIGRHIRGSYRDN